MLNRPIRSLAPLAAAVAVALSVLGPASVSAAPCADPAGNCPNGGQVTFPTPAPSTQRQPCADPSGNCPNGGQSDAPNPNPNNNAMPTLNVQVNPSAGAPGDIIAVVGQGFTANGRGNLIFINLVDANGNRRDTNYQPISCVNTEDTLLNLYQDLGWGCSGDASGALVNSDGSGAFAAAFTIPDGVAAGAGQVCISSVFSNPVCTALMVRDSSDN